MLKFIDDIFNCFQSCFSRKAAFRWFVIITLGLMLRSDKLGITSVIRALPLRPDCYETMLHFFRASSWSLESLRLRWFETVLRFAPLYKVNNRTVLIGDGVKQAKEGRRMPGVKKLFQESENSSKPQYIYGHLFGGLGILAGDISKWFCIPLCLLIHDDIVTTPFLLLSKLTMDVVKLYGEPVYKRDVIIISKHNQQSKQYYLTMLETAGKGRILWEESNLFYMDIRNQKEIVISQDFAESILRRGAVGIDLEEIEMG